MQASRERVVNAAGIAIGSAFVVSLMVFAVLHGSSPRELARMYGTSFVPAQYVNWLTHMLTGRWGVVSVGPHETSPVVTEVLTRLPYDALLLVAPLAVACGLVILLRRVPEPYGRVLEYFQCVPVFWSAMMLQLIAIHTGRLPAAGVSSNGAWNVGDVAAHMLLPGTALLLYFVARLLSDRGLSLRRAIARWMPEFIAATALVAMIYAWPAAGKFFFASLAMELPFASCAVLVTFACLAIIIRFITAIFEPGRASAIDAFASPRILSCLPLLLLCVVVLAANALGHADPYVIDNQNWRGDPLPPCFVKAAACAGHLLGTDETGRDMLARLIAGGKIDVGLSAAGAAIAFAFGAGLFWIKRNGRRAGALAVDAVAGGIGALPPWMLLLAALTAASDHDGYHPSLFGYALLAGAVLSPNVVTMAERGSALPSMARGALLQWLNALLLIATIDFFGFGTQPPVASWGNMLANAESVLEQGWWGAVFPGACIVISGMCIFFAWRASAGSAALRQPQHDTEALLNSAASMPID